MAVASMLNQNHPTLARKDLMSLSTISSNDERTRPFKKMDTSRDWSINLFNLDIAGTIPKRFGIFTNKIDFINKVNDIEKTNSKLLHFPLDKPEYNLTNKDIERSEPNMGHLKTKRCCDPLEPKYALPKVVELPMDPPKFLRDAIGIDDIQGARPKKYFMWDTRETFPKDNHGIEGSKTKTRYIRKTKFENIDYSDLTKDNFRTTRHVHPLDPVYEFKNKKTGEAYQFGQIEKSKPQTIYPFTHPDPFGLKVDDIKGTNAGSLKHINKFNGPNMALCIKDIRGCSAGSLKKGITTTRNLNPLTPNYQYIGNKELGNDYNLYGKEIIQTLPNKKKSTPMKKEQSSLLPSVGGGNIAQTEPNINNQGAIYEEQKNGDGLYETGFNNQLYKVDKVVFNEEDYIKPKPYYGLIHDQYVISSENLDKLAKLEKEKGERITSQAVANISDGFTNSQYPFMKNTSNDNLTTHCNTQLIPPEKLGMNKTSSMNMGKSGIPQGSVSEIRMGQSDMMNRTATNGQFTKRTYAQQLDKFMETNKLKYV